MSGSGRRKTPKTSVDAFETTMNAAEAWLTRQLSDPPPPPGRLHTPLMDARVIERMLTDAQLEDPRYPQLLARLRHLEQQKRIGRNPVEPLRARIQAAAELLRDHPGELADQLLAILRPDEP